LITLQLVEQRVRKGLAAIKTGESTPQQALQSVVRQLSKELSEQQFSLLVDHFQTKHTKGKLCAAKQLLLQALCAVRVPKTHDTREQQPDQSCPNHSSTISSKTSAVVPISPVFLQPCRSKQEDFFALPSTAAAAVVASAATRDTSRPRDQNNPLGAVHQQLLSEQQQQQQATQHNAGSDTPTAAALAACTAGSSRHEAFRQSLSPLQV
jgi:hypothetical protein